MLTSSIKVGSLLVFLVFIDSLFYEDFLQRGIEKLLHEFPSTYAQLLANKVFCLLCIVVENIRDGKEFWLVVLYHTAVRGYAHLAVCESIQGIDGLVRRNAWGEVYENLHFCSSHILHLPCLDLSLFNSGGDRGNKSLRVL